MEVGRHILIDFFGCEEAYLQDEVGLRSLVEDTARHGGCRVLALHTRRYEPHGLTAYALLAEDLLTGGTRVRQEPMRVAQNVYWRKP